MRAPDHIRLDNMRRFRITLGYQRTTHDQVVEEIELGPRRRAWEVDVFDEGEMWAASIGSGAPRTTTSPALSEHYSARLARPRRANMLSRSQLAEGRDCKH